MSDELNLSLWFPSFAEAEMMPRTLSVLRQFPCSQARPGITAAAAYPLNWSETPVYSHTFDFPVDPERAVTLVTEFLHDDYAYEFEALWDLWMPVADQNDLRSALESLLPPGTSDEAAQQLLARAEQTKFEPGWANLPYPVKFIAQGLRFEEGDYQETGHVLVKLGLDAPFLYEEGGFGDTENRMRSNVQKLINFTSAVEKNCGISGRVLWSESEENLAQKLIARLQRVQ